MHCSASPGAGAWMQGTCPMRDASQVHEWMGSASVATTEDTVCAFSDKQVPDEC